MGLSYGTTIAIPGSGEVAIERIAVGDQVLVGSLRGEALSWSAQSVIYSGGADRPQPQMSYLSFEGGSELVCDVRQPLLRSDRRMMRAHRLVPGERLLTPDGNSLEIRSHALGASTRGVHGIAFAGGWNGRPDGHLIGVGGVVGGDYLVELYMEEER